MNLSDTNVIYRAVKFKSAQYLYEGEDGGADSPAKSIT